MSQDDSRRDFFRAMFGTAVTAALARQALAQQDSPNGLPTRRLGRTNEQVSILGLGGWHIGLPARGDRQEAIRIMHAAIDEGLTFFDNSWDYHDGLSEEVMGEALSSAGRRQKVFLMTKNCERDYEGSRRNLEESLRRLQTDHVDLWQFHEMVYDNDPDWVFERGGIKYALEAQKAGKVRHIGFTGHKDPRIHRKMLHKPYDWATSQMPINVMDAHYRSFQKNVLPVCLKQNVGVIGMKSLGGGKIPSDTSLTVQECRGYALSLPISTLCAGITSMKDLQQDLAIARNFKPFSDAEKKQILARAEPDAGDGRHELFKSTQTYDGPHHRRQHGFEA